MNQESPCFSCGECQDHDAMISHLMQNEEYSEEDAIEWLEYNTLRTIPYMGEHAPVIIYSFFVSED